MREVQGIRMQRDQQLECDGVQRGHMKPHSCCLMSTCVFKIVSLVSLLSSLLITCSWFCAPSVPIRLSLAKGCVQKLNMIRRSSRSDKQINAVSAVLPPQLCCCKGRPFPGRRVSSRKTQASRDVNRKGNLIQNRAWPPPGRVVTH